MTSEQQYARETILRGLVGILEDMTSDWDMEFDRGIGAETKLIADLEFESIDVVQFILAIEEHFQREKLPFEKLIMEHGRYVDEICLGDAVGFLYDELNRPAAEPV